MNRWEAMERENHVAERGLVPVSAGDVQVQHDHGGAAKTDGFVRRDQSWYTPTHILNEQVHANQVMELYFDASSVLVSAGTLAATSQAIC